MIAVIDLTIIWLQVKAIIDTLLIGFDLIKNSKRDKKVANQSSLINIYIKFTS